jgi:hypothetical protein
MTQIHPELNRILEEYNKISTNYENGSIQLPDAIASIAQLQVIDGLGWVWGIDHNTGNFVRSTPGSPELVPSDPEEFAPSQIPYTQSHFDQPRAPYDTVVPSWEDAPGITSSPHDAWTPPAPPPSRRGTARTSKRTPRLRPSKEKTLQPSSSGAVMGFVSQNRRTVIIAVVVVVLLSFALLSRRAPSTPPTSTLPPATSLAPTTQPPRPTTTRPVSIPTRAPSAGEMSRAFAGISRASTSVRAILSFVDNPGNHVAVVQHVAFFTGLTSVHALLQQTPATHTGTSTAQSTFTFLDASTHEVLYTGKVYWVRHTAAWRMSTWPTFT